EEGSASPRTGDAVCSSNFYGFPDISTAHSYSAGEKNVFMLGNVLGYDTKRVDAYEETIMEEMGITLDLFKVRKLPGLGSKGTLRPLFAPYLGFSSTAMGGSATIRFSLPAGSYATVLLNEFLEIREPEAAPPQRT
ncbi:MAG: tRNA pseudouridine(13) synthase TruD, partial [Candidatus Micrarchaeaceae archaeon]